MTDTYCEKDCAQCAYKEKLQCPGCKSGPGHETLGDCPIARCCRSSRRESCRSCSVSGRCSSLQSMHQIPKDRIFNREAEAEKQADIVSRAQELSKLLRAIFWLEIVICIASLLTADLVVKLVPGLYWPGRSLEQILRLAAGLIFLKMSSGEARYQRAGLCAIAAVLASSAAAILADSLWANFLLAITSVILLLICEYFAFSAHAGVLTGVDNILSEKWDNLWKWRLIVYVNMIGTTFLKSFSGFHPTLTALINTFYVSALVMVYIFRIMEVWDKHGKHRTAGNSIMGTTDTSPHENRRVTWTWMRFEYIAAIFIIILVAVFGLLTKLTYVIAAVTSILMLVYLCQTVKKLREYTNT